MPELSYGKEYETVKAFLNVKRTVSGCIKPTGQKVYQSQMRSDQTKSKLLALDEEVSIRWSKLLLTKERIWVTTKRQSWTSRN